MIELPLYRWGRPYTSLDVDEVRHFATGEPVARVSRANGGLIQRDARQAAAAREALRRVPVETLIGMCVRAGELFLTATLPMGEGTQSPDQFVAAQSATTGMPEAMCRANMRKSATVLADMHGILTALTRRLDFRVLSEGWGVEDGVPVSYQAQTSALGLVLPSNTSGVHTLWLPAIPLQVGLVLKPGPQEPWTPYRLAAAFWEAGVPREAISLYPGGPDVGAAVLEACGRSLIFGGEATVARYAGHPRVQAHGPGFSKILLGDDVVDDWERYLDLMVESVCASGGRGCINASGVWASRHTEAIADALARRLAAIRPRPFNDPDAALAAFTVPGAAEAVDLAVAADLAAPGVTDCTARHREGPRLVREGAATYLLPTVAHCDSAQPVAARREYMFPFVSVVTCPEARMVEAIGPTLVCTAITEQTPLRRALTDATHVDRLNVGPVPTVALNWRQPHEGNLVDFLFRARAYQVAPVPATGPAGIC